MIAISGLGSGIGIIAIYGSTSEASSISDSTSSSTSDSSSISDVSETNS